MDANLWYKPRHYLHFDKPISLKKASSIVTSSTRVSSHSFYPFLAYEILSKKIIKDPVIGITRKEKIRPISFASHVDAHIYSYYCQLLTIPYEAELNRLKLSSNVIAFRKLGKSNIDFANDAFSFIKNKGGCTAICYDISGFFNNLDHDLLKEKWAKMLQKENLPKDHYSVYKSITKFSTVNRSDLYKNLGISTTNPKDKDGRICSPSEFRNRIRAANLIKPNPNKNLRGQLIGIPQGSPISAFLSNLYMIDFDHAVAEAVEEIGGMYCRYCDDMLFVIPTEWKVHIGDFVRKEIKKLNIDINPDKTEVRDFEKDGGRLRADKPLQYLGFLFDGQSCYIRSSSLARYSERMKRGVNLAKLTKIKHNRIRASRGLPLERLYKRKLYNKYSHLGNRNFVRYGLRAAQIMGSKTIKRQLKPLWNRLNERIKK